jgi:nicotinamidase-related amidase
VSEPGFIDRLVQSGRQQIIVAGMEAHVCVMQTVLALCEANWQVFIVEDVVGSAQVTDQRAALARMGSAGASIVTKQMVFFEWLRIADTKEFSSLLRRYITQPSARLGATDSKQILV